MDTHARAREEREIDFEQAQGSGRVLPVENLSTRGQFKNSCSDIYGVH